MPWLLEHLVQTKVIKQMLGQTRKELPAINKTK